MTLKVRYCFSTCHYDAYISIYCIYFIFCLKTHFITPSTVISNWYVYDFPLHDDDFVHVSIAQVGIFIMNFEAEVDAKDKVVLTII